jgi:D-arabinose 1-dehydrogenase-like Zn-dependent alcohol dehydrogenase
LLPTALHLPTVNNMTKYTAALVTEKDGAFQLQQLEIPTPGRDEVVIKVHACGLCHSDTFSVHGAFGNSFPIAPGHEVSSSIHAP